MAIARTLVSCAPCPCSTFLIFHPLSSIPIFAGHYGEKGVSWTATKLALRDASGLVAALGEALTSPLSAAKLRVLITHMKEEMLTSGGGEGVVWVGVGWQQECSRAWG